MRSITVRPFRLYCLLSIALGLLLTTQAHAYEDTLQNARQMLEQGDANAAYASMKAVEVDRSGEPEFDYWLGVFALRAGDVSHALIALDRVLIAAPEHAGARMERVAALLQLDQRRAAEEEIERLEALSPPPEAQAAIRRFKEVIKQRRGEDNDPQHNLSVGVALGYDSNPQRYSRDIELDPLPPSLRDVVDQLIDSGALEPDGPNQLDDITFASRSSLYHRLQANYRGRYPIDERSRWLLDATAQTQRYTQDSAEEIDLTLLQLAPAYQRELSNGHTWTLQPNVLQGWGGANQDPLLTRWGLSGHYAYTVGTDSQLTWQLRAQRNDFDNALSDYDAGRLGVELTTPLTHVNVRWQARVGKEWARGTGNQQRAGGDLNHWQVGMGLDVPIGNRQLIRGDVGYRERNYQDDVNNITSRYQPTAREEQIWEARLSWLYQLNRHWLVETSANYEQRDATIEFYDSTRLQTQVGVRYLF
ncbi:MULTISPECIES: hypothetical protein [unclassified Halomonas]|uniref:hypothetical protein n=1 Tax=unclassified Halomonas TaxID=2609666 RepID=UPI0007D97BF0|nr:MULTISPECIES: hypothetical protein [unclassified Halomonas]MBT2786850.1 hypothetical protein [Halomonas sp. ISL-106]MBT2798497.1 hypothetical protein [Halomonas sp. ISL-104]OAL58130.1 hypothetical protein A6R74_09885 [Halomonas sp. ALS9]